MADASVSGLQGNDLSPGTTILACAKLLVGDGGGLNLGCIDKGDWLMYNMEVTKSGTYKLESRIAVFNSSSLYFTFNETNNSEISLMSTEGWQNLEGFSTNVYIEKGDYDMKVASHSDGFNINYSTFDLITGLDEHKPLFSNIDLFPNPII